MSAQNVRMVEKAFADFANGSVDDVWAALHSDVELRGAVGGLEEGEVRRGREAVAEQLLPDSSVWAERRYFVQELIDADDRVVALVRERRRGRGSGVEIEAEIGLVYWFKEGKVSLIEPYMSQSEALASVGMS